MDKRLGTKTSEIAVMDQDRVETVVTTLKQLIPTAASPTAPSFQTLTPPNITVNPIPVQRMNADLYQSSVSFKTPAMLLHPTPEQTKDLQDIKEIQNKTGLNVSDASDLFMTSQGNKVTALTTHKKEQVQTAKTNQPTDNTKSGSSLPESELAILKSMWDSVSSILPDKTLPDPQTMTAADWNKAQRAKSGLALENALSAGRTLKDNVIGFKDKVIGFQDNIIGTGEDIGKLGREALRTGKQAKIAIANDLRRFGWDIAEGTEDVVDFLTDLPMDATVKSTEYIMESMGFVDFQLDGERLGTDIGSSYKNKVDFLAKVGNQVADEMEAVNSVIQGERAVLFSEIGGGIKNAASEVGSGIKKVAKNITEPEEFDPSDIGYNPAQNTGLEAPEFDPAQASQLITSAVEAISESVAPLMQPKEGGDPVSDVQRDEEGYPMVNLPKDIPTAKQQPISKEFTALQGELSRLLKVQSETRSEYEMDLLFRLQALENKYPLTKKENKERNKLRQEIRNRNLISLPLG